jgi:tetratricopeptide (TPR) repeat protein
MLDGDQQKLILKLIRVKDDRQIWGNEYNGDRKTNSRDLFIATEDVAKAINAKITHEEKKGISKVQTTNFSAIDYYQQGKKWVSEYDARNSNPEPLYKAKVFFTKSLECDSSYAPAYAGIAEIYWNKYDWRDKNKDKYLDSVLLMANRAIFYDDRCADAYMFRGLVYNESGKKTQALKDAEKALKCNPNDRRVYSTWFEINQDYNNVDGWIRNIAGHYEVIKRFGVEDKIQSLFWLSWCYDFYGFYELSKKCTLQRLELNQDSAGFYYHMQWVEFNAGHFDEAYKYAKRLYEKDTTHLDPESIQYYTYSGHDKEAYEYARKYVEHCKKTGKPFKLLHRIAYAYWKAGKTKEAEDFYKLELENYFKDVKKRKLEGFINEDKNNIVLAIDYVMLGEKENAFQYLNYDDKNSIPMFGLIILKYDPAFDAIREDPRFQKVIKAYEAQFQAKHDRLKKWLEEQGYV